jgi:hypothetical protein
MIRNSYICIEYYDFFVPFFFIFTITIFFIFPVAYAILIMLYFPIDKLL